MSGSRDPDVWRKALCAAPELIAAVAAARDPDRPSPAETARVRRHASPEVTHALFELAAARRRAARRHFDDADQLASDRSGLEQASGSAEARYKAARFADAVEQDRNPTVIDLCCGIGADTRALRAALPDSTAVHALDIDPVRLLLCRHNAVGANTLLADARGLPFDDATIGRALVHFDPARRAEGGGRGADRRLRAIEALQPSLADVLPTLTTARGAATKLSPATAFEDLPDPGERSCETEVIGTAHGDGLTQIVWWLGALARTTPTEPIRTATRLGKDRGVQRTWSAPERVIDSTPRPRSAADGVGAHLIVPDPALERAGLVPARIAEREFGMLEIAPGLGLWTDRAGGSDAWFERYRVHEVLGWRRNRVAAWLSRNGAGEVVVRTRGGAVDATAEAKRLRGSGSRRFLVFGLRLGKRVVAVMTTPVDADADPSAPDRA